MANVSGPPPPFGVGKVLSDAFQVFTKAAIPLIMIMGGSAVASSLLVVGVGGGAALAGGGVMSGGGQFFVTVASMLITVIAFGASAAVAYESGFGRPVSIAGAVSAGAGQVLPLAVLSLVFYVVLVIFMTLFIVPGLWIMGVWAATVPAIMIERAGFGALGRSARLTKGYRWPVIGTLILIGIITIIATTITLGIVYSLIGTSFEAIFTGAAASLQAPSIPVIAAIIAIQAIMNGVFYGLTAAVIVSIYIRLTDIKEGGDTQGLENVFD